MSQTYIVLKWDIIFDFRENVIMIKSYFGSLREFIVEQKAGKSVTDLFGKKVMLSEIQWRLTILFTT